MTVMIPEELFCTPAMASLHEEVDQLTTEVPVAGLFGQPMGSYSMPLDPEATARIKALVNSSHALGYAEGAADWF